MLPPGSVAIARSTGSFKPFRLIFCAAFPMVLAFYSRLIHASICFIVLVGSGFFRSFSSSFVSALIKPFLYSFRGVFCLIIDLIWDGIRFFCVVFCLVSLLIWSFWNFNRFAAANGLPRRSYLNAVVRFL